MASKLSSFLAEMKRRKVYHVAVTYVVVAAGTIGLADDALGQIWERLPLVVLVLFLVGFPIAVVLAWAYEVRPEEPRKAEEGTAGAGESSIAGDRKSIVVLPFDNMSPDPGDAYFADGLTEEIITSLSHLRSLRVISRNSAMVLKGTQKDTRAIARELDVQLVLEGSVRKAGQNLRITAQLIDATFDEHLWAEKYDGVLEDVFGMQEQVSQSIVAALQLEISPREAIRLTERPIEDLGAYQSYLRARNDIGGYTVEGVDRAIRELNAALEIVGGNPFLSAGLAYAHYQRANLGVAQDEAIASAEEHVTQALALDPEFPVALAVRGLLNFTFQGNPQEAVVLFKRALAQDPNEPLALMYLAGAYAMMAGRPDAARPVVDRLLKVDPLGGMTRWLRGGLPFFEGAFADAAIEWRRWLETTPDNPLAKAWIAPAVAYAGDLQGALQLLTEPELPKGPAVGSRLCRIQSCALQGEKEGALAEITAEFRQTLVRDGAWAWLTAAPLAFLGATTEAVELLGLAVRRGGFINYPMLAEYDPFLASLSGHSAFQAILAEAKEAWASFEV